MTRPRRLIGLCSGLVVAVSSLIAAWPASVAPAFPTRSSIGDYFRFERHGDISAAVGNASVPNDGPRPTSHRATIRSVRLSRYGNIKTAIMYGEAQSGGQ